MTGDQDDIAARIWRLLPPWWGDPTTSPVISAVVQGTASALAFACSLYAYAKLQTRIATATGGWLDLAASDFFDKYLRRFSGESDAIYARRIRLEVLRDRNTRHGIDRAVFDLTGAHPTSFEAFRPADCGGYGVATAIGYGVAGAYGSLGCEFQVLITTPTPHGFGVPNRPGWDDPAGGLEVTFSLASDLDVVASGPTLTDVLAALERCRTAGVTYLVRFT